MPCNRWRNHLATCGKMRRIDLSCLWLGAATICVLVQPGAALAVGALGRCRPRGAELFRCGSSQPSCRLRPATPAAMCFRMDGGRGDEGEVQGRRRVIDVENTLGSRGFKELLVFTVAIGFIAGALSVRTRTRGSRFIEGARGRDRKAAPVHRTIVHNRTMYTVGGE